MTLEIKIPSPGESITEVEIGKWLVKDGVIVEKDQEIAEVESDKATFSLSATAAGRIKILLKEGQRVPVGSTACTLETTIEKAEEQASVDKTKEKKSTGGKIQSIKDEKEVSETAIQEEEKKPKTEMGDIESQETEKELSKEPETEKSKEIEEPQIQEREIQQDYTRPDEAAMEDNSKVKFTAAAKAVMNSEGLSIDEVVSGIHRLNRQDVESVISILKSKSEPPSGNLKKEASQRSEERVPISALRRKLSQRLVAVKNETAMLTTFNEIDMLRMVQLRTKYQKSFSEKYGIKLGYMSFFTKAASIALGLFPTVNSMLDGEEIIFPNYQDIGIAVQTEKGLMVPIIRDAGKKNIPELEKEIAQLAEKARNKKLTVQEMTGGTFTITNGGLFGSLMSTPIINPPQSAILGMHAIKDRPIAVDNKVEIRPMMYVAVSYDHRLIDGKDSVSFLFKLKELIENPTSLLFQGKNAEDFLLGL